MSQFDQDLDGLLAGFSPPIAALAREVVALLASVRPDLTAKVAVGWKRALFRHPKHGFICSVVPGRERVLLMFQDGRLLDSPLLEDDGRVVKVRWMAFHPGDVLPVDDVAILLAESIALRG